MNQTQININRIRAYNTTEMMWKQFRRIIQDAAFNESEHPRNEKGEFARSNTRAEREENNKSDKFSSRVRKVLGKEFIGYKGKSAIDKLLKEKRGYIKGAFKNPTFGDIALVYGNENLGLRHIILHRKKQGFSDKRIKTLLYSLDDVISNGKVSVSSGGRNTFKIYKDEKVAIISPNLWGDKITFVLTAYKARNKNRQ